MINMVRKERDERAGKLRKGSGLSSWKKDDIAHALEKAA